MPIRASGRLLVLACVLALLASGTASASDAVLGQAAVDSDDAPELAGSVDPSDSVDLDDSVDLSASAGALDEDVNVSAETDSSGDGESVSAGASTNLSDTSASLDAGADDTTASVDADATASDADAGVTVDASTSDPSLDSSIDAHVALDADVEWLYVDGRVATANDGSVTVGTGGGSDGEERDEQRASTYSPGQSQGGIGGIPLVPDGSGPAAAVGVAAVAGAAATRRGIASVGNGSAPLAALRDALVAAVHWLRTHLPALVPLRYSRYDDSDPLEHAVRADLYDVVQTAPGVNLSGLEARVDVSMSSVRHHLRVLEDESLIESARIRGKRRYFPAYAANAELLAALDEPATASVLRTLAAMEAATVSDLADRLGRDPSTITHHLTRLEDAGLVERERDGPAVVSRLADGPRRVLAGDETADELATAD